MSTAASFFNKGQLTIIAGPCMLESLELGLEVGFFMADLCKKHGFRYVFKASFDKANRTSDKGQRGPGITQGLADLLTIKKELNVPVLTDIHTPEQAVLVAEVADILQIPAFLCRNRALLTAAIATNKAVQIKKGQHLTAFSMLDIAKIIELEHKTKVILCERGACFGYNNLVVDYRNLIDLSDKGYPVVFDATHSAQLPGAGNGITAGLDYVIAGLTRAAVAVGIDGLFLEVHKDPKNALSDAATQVDFKTVETITSQVAKLYSAMQK